MSKHLIDTSPKLAECARCKAYVIAGMSSGVRYVVEPVGLNYITATAMIFSGVGVHYIDHKIMKPVTTLSLSSEHKLDRVYYRSHGCGCSALDASAFEGVVDNPLPAPAPSELAVFERQGLTCSVVQDVRPHRSDVVRCDQCGVLMNHEDMVMIEMPHWETNTHKVPNRGSRKGYTRHYGGWGYTRWARHPDGCQAAGAT